MTTANNDYITEDPAAAAKRKKVIEDMAKRYSPEAKAERKKAEEEQQAAMKSDLEGLRGGYQQYVDLTDRFDTLKQETGDLRQQVVGLASPVGRNKGKGMGANAYSIHPLLADAYKQGGATQSSYEAALASVDKSQEANDAYSIYEGTAPIDAKHAKDQEMAMSKDINPLLAEAYKVRAAQRSYDAGVVPFTDAQKEELDGLAVNGANIFPETAAFLAEQRIADPSEDPNYFAEEEDAAQDAASADDEPFYSDTGGGPDAPSGSNTRDPYKYADPYSRSRQNDNRSAPAKKEGEEPLSDDSPVAKRDRYGNILRSEKNKAIGFGYGDIPSPSTSASSDDSPVAKRDRYGNILRSEKNKAIGFGMDRTQGRRLESEAGRARRLARRAQRQGFKRAAEIGGAHALGKAMKTPGVITEEMRDEDKRRAAREAEVKAYMAARSTNQPTARTTNY